MSSKLYLLIFLLVSNAYLQDIFNPSNPWAEYVENQMREKCKTIIRVRDKGEFKVGGRISKEKLPTECVNDLALEMNGETYCISGKGNDKLQCKEEGKNETSFITVPRLKIHFHVIIVPVCQCGISKMGDSFERLDLGMITLLLQQRFSQILLSSFGLDNSSDRGLIKC